jgi:hypothetical protein
VKYSSTPVRVGRVKAAGLPRTKLF